MLDVFKAAAEYGVLGIACLVLVLALVQLYKHGRADKKDSALELKLERDGHLLERSGRLDDAKRFTDVALKLQAEVISAVASINKANEENAKLCGLVEKLVAALEERNLPPKRR